MSQNDRYTSPLSERYASREMQYIFSPDMKFKTWRRLWIALSIILFLHSSCCRPGSDSIYYNPIL